MNRNYQKIRNHFSETTRNVVSGIEKLAKIGSIEVVIV